MEDSLNQKVNPQNWTANIQFIVQQATGGLDVTIVGFHHSKRSESIYLNLIRDGRLFQIRYAWHQA